MYKYENYTSIVLNISGGVFRRTFNRFDSSLHLADVLSVAMRHRELEG